MLNKKLCAAAALLGAAGAWAQTAADAGGDAGQLEAVNVTARRSIEQRFFAPGSLVVVDRADIEQLGAFSVADVLKQLPGVVVTTSGDGSVEVRMRGMERGATQLLVDGQRTSSGRGQLALDQLPPEMIERIEVVRSPSAEFSGATGGTINLVLRQASVKRETVIRLTDNTVWGRHAGQAFFSRTGPLGGGTPVAATDDPNAPGQPWAYFVSLGSIGTLLGSDVQREVSEGGNTTRTDAVSRYRRREVSVVPRVSGRIGAADQLALRGTLIRTDFGGDYRADGVTSPAGAAFTSSERQDQDREYVQGAADWTRRFQRSKLETSIGGSSARESVDRQGFTAAGTGGPAFDGYTIGDDRRETLWTVRSKLTGTADSMLWTFGGEADRRELTVDNRANGAATAYGAVLDRRVLWGQNEWEVLNGGTFTAGLRGETLTTETRAAGTTAEWRSSFLQPSLHLRKPIRDDLQWRANLARTTRNPRVWDLIDRTLPSQGTNSIVSPDMVGNPDLRPERSLALDTGVEMRLGAGGVAGVNLFVREVRDAIAPLVALAGGRWVEQRVNIGDARVWGLEFDAKTGLQWLGLSREWTLAANASLLQSRMTSGVNLGERIPGQPRYTASVTAARPIRRSGGLYGGGTLTVTGASDLNTSPGRTGRDAARAALDLYVGQVIRGLGYWRVGVFNIGDAPFRRERRSVDPSGATTLSTSEMTLTPRVYLTIGTQF